MARVDEVPTGDDTAVAEGASPPAPPPGGVGGQAARPVPVLPLAVVGGDGRPGAIAMLAYAREGPAGRQRLLEALDRGRSYAEVRSRWAHSQPWGVPPRDDAMHGLERERAAGARERSRSPTGIPDMPVGPAGAGAGAWRQP